MLEIDKKIDISIPELQSFVHKVYIHTARKCYSNVYLFDIKITPLQKQKNNRELEQIIQECILTTIRESIPTEEIIRAYLDESEEQEEEVIIEDIKEGDKDLEEIEKKMEVKEEEDNTESNEKPIVPTIANIDNEPVVTRLTFNDIDSVQDASTGKIDEIKAPKDIERLEEISTSNAIKRKLEEEEDDELDKIQIHTDNVSINDLDILDIEKSSHGNDELLLDDFEVLA